MSILIQSSFDTALHKLNNMVLPHKLIKIIGIINNLNVNILIDTGASVSIIFEHTINRLNINYLIDTEEKSCLNGIGSNISIGRLWYIDLNLDNLLYPISLVASNTTISDFDIILGINFLRNYNSSINFNTNQLILNNTHIISF